MRHPNPEYTYIPGSDRADRDQGGAGARRAHRREDGTLEHETLNPKPKK